MSDPAGELYTAMRAALKADTALQAAVGSTTVKVYDIPPVNTAGDYIVAGQDDVLDVKAECKSLRETEATVHIWSLTDPPGLVKCKAIGAAVQAVLLALGDLPSFSMIATEFVRSRYLIDADGKTAHGVISVNYTTEPA